MWDRDAPLANQIHKYLICCSQVWACTRLGAAEKPKDEFFSIRLDLADVPAPNSLWGEHALQEIELP